VGCGLLDGPVSGVVLNSPAGARSDIEWVPGAVAREPACPSSESAFHQPDQFAAGLPSDGWSGPPANAGTRTSSTVPVTASPSGPASPGALEAR
jgi:hypothetical protein